jgi:hypothetical protein
VNAANLQTRYSAFNYAPLQARVQKVAPLNMMTHGEWSAP